MGYRLLVDLEALAVLDVIPKRVRARLLDHFIRLRATPDTPSTTGLILRIGTSRSWLSSLRIDSNVRLMNPKDAKVMKEFVPVTVSATTANAR